VVASLKSHGKNWMTEDEPRVMAFIDWARRTYPIDVRRIVLQGVSNGGWFVNYFGSRHLDLVAGVVTLCNGGGFDLKKTPNASESAPEFYVVHGTDDKDVNVKNSRNAVGLLRGLGYRFVYREYPGVAHNVYDDERTRHDFAAWVERLRNKTMPLCEEDRKALVAFAKSEDADRLIQTLAGAATLLRIGGVPAERILVRSLHARVPAVRASAAGLLARTVCSPGISALISQSLDDKDDSVQQAALGTLTAIADWNDQEALVALCLCAGTRNHPREERLSIVDHLVHALAFRSSPGPDNQLIYELLVHLLEDEDQDLRSAGLAGLMGSAAKPASPFGYRPEAAASARREPVAHWKAWFLDAFAAPAEKK
jgi:dienelactone hydrolase